MKVATRLARGLAILLVASTADAQAAVASGPTVRAARVAFFDAPTAFRSAMPIDVADHRCGSHLKNAVMLGLGVSLAVGVLELTYTIIREPFVRNGRDVPRADPMLIAWGGGAGFVIGIIGTELCRRRR